MFDTIRSWLGGKDSVKASRKSPPRRTVLRVENLEGREMLSASYPGFSLSGGNLYNAAISQTQPIDTGVQNFAVVNNEVYDFHLGGVLESMSPDGSGKVGWDSNVQQMAVTSNGQLFTMHYGSSNLYCFNGTSNSLWDSNVQSFGIRSDGNVYVLSTSNDLTLVSLNGTLLADFGTVQGFAMGTSGGAYFVQNDNLTLKYAYAEHPGCYG